ncbi:MULTISPECIES: PLP-dependent aminotransferase family protein [unclassified Crossiella]|uniref:MocR-like pyridoxine biosynthesis transcription factor PdxR n=1 Tax=unclassified Crossiella TaxID=2620835 RepID=UPI001FFFCAA1|nr:MULTISPECIES: PLP-dependent aminotransferase family protein [unclassified Crossiella]MCK2244664.1 PLP-dependent aminotransferase family protein [Crossiella sp. S99.2]MCK2258349.1 PLP-dependent aminotransferase family protein [Crossiella sp. S99.1]
MAARPSGLGTDFLQLRPETAPAKGLTDWLVGALRSAIGDGRLSGGALLPPTRALADDLDVSRGVVVEAYRRLAEEGLVSARTSHGTVVTAAVRPGPCRADPPQRSGPGRFLPELPGARDHRIDLDLAPGTPDLSAFPRAAWLRAERAVLNQVSPSALAYGDPRGSIELRTQLAGWLGRVRGVRAHPEDILIVGGVAQAVALLSHVLRGRGVTRFAVEDPGSRGAREGLTYSGMTPVPVPVDADGLRVDALTATGERTVLVTPAHQFPTGVVLAPDRRGALLDWARQGGLIIEDDYDAEYRYDRAPVPALQSAAPEHVAHTGSISKTMAPGMRIGWLIAPRELQNELVLAKYANDLGSPVLPQLVLADLLGSGELDRHIRVTRLRYRARRDAFTQTLRRAWPAARVHGVAAGLHVLIDFPESCPKLDDVALATRLAEAGVLTHPLSWHRVRPGPPGLLVGYAANSPDRLREAARRIADLLRP